MAKLQLHVLNMPGFIMDTLKFYITPSTSSYVLKTSKYINRMYLVMQTSNCPNSYARC